jgi:hypothetical protein
MSEVFAKSLNCFVEIITRFHQVGRIEKEYFDERRGIADYVFTSDRFRRAHVSVVDARESKKVWLLHVTVFPHTNDPSPIYGFDIVAGPTKVSGAFHDFSAGGETNHSMIAWFADRTRNIIWNKKRELPDWAKNIFSSSMVAIGAVGEEELDEFVKLGLESLDYYLVNVGLTQQDLADFHMAQNYYCANQKQNPHTPRVLVNLGFTEQEAKDFVEQMLFPEIG